MSAGANELSLSFFSPNASFFVILWHSIESRCRLNRARSSSLILLLRHTLGRQCAWRLYNVMNDTRCVSLEYLSNFHLQVLRCNITYRVFHQVYEELHWLKRSQQMHEFPCDHPTRQHSASWADIDQMTLLYPLHRMDDMLRCDSEINVRSLASLLDLSPCHHRPSHSLKRISNLRLFRLGSFGNWFFSVIVWIIYFIVL